MSRVGQIREARIRTAKLLRDQRPCTLTWGELAVLAREGRAEEGLEIMPGAALDRKSCTFYVLKDLLREAPPIDTIFALDGRDGEEWQLNKIYGRSPNDIEWVFQCTEIR